MIYILRGVAGAGKSHWIVESPTYILSQRVFSADRHHVGADGVYRYDPARAGEAHARCLRSYLNHLASVADGDDPLSIFVDNTNTTVWELAAYVRAAEAYGRSYQIVRVHCDPLVAFRRNTHGVPLDVILRMHANLLTERLPGRWKEIVVPAG